ncbi:MAG: hypothetical protein CMP59_09560 [Flavobacteriales bacterium]|nr:hypothetical protein [Flavobacteriales bacterium]|tara:strand:+ start:87 stop:872 length:786 start_codon:yes stop_codon:yes gene_type:complete
MAIITLTTDLGLKDHYVGVVKGSILSQCPEVNIVDISHLIPPYDIMEAAFTLRNAYSSFPENSIHIIGVNPEIDANSDHLLVRYKGQYFIGADNGVFSLIMDEEPEEVYELNISPTEEDLTFPTKDVFTKAACHLAKGGTAPLIGKQIDGFKKRMPFQAVTHDNVIKGIVIHVDHYGNIISNIEETLFKAFGSGREFTIEFRGGDYDIKNISKSYSDLPEGEKLAIFGSSSLLEISINKGNASQLLGLRKSDTIRIVFHDR